MNRYIIAICLSLVSFFSHAEWHYGSEKDAMTDESISYAYIASENSEKVGSVTRSSQKMYLSIKSAPSKGMNMGLMFAPPDGSEDPVYYMCKFQVDAPCSVMVRFDSDPAETLMIVPPPTGGDDLMFFVNPELVYVKLKKSKVVQIRASIYNAGEVTFKFNTEGFKGLQ